MTKSELIESIVDSQDQLTSGDVELAVKNGVRKNGLHALQKRENRNKGFGSFCLHHRAARL